MPGLQRARRRLRPGLAAHPATREGDEYVISGHKVWTSYSDAADWCLVLARTDPDVPKHRGISAFVVPMDQPGIEQRPLPMINGITKEFGEVLFDGARVPAANMIGAPGEGWALAMTIVSHEREPGELGYAGRYKKLVKELVALAKRTRRFGAEQLRDLAWAIVEAEMLRLHVSRRLSDRLDGISHGSEGSVDKLLMTWTEQAVGHAAPGHRRRGEARRGRHLAEGLPLQPGPERHGRHVADPAEPHGQPDPGAAVLMSAYDLPDELQIRRRPTVRSASSAEPARPPQRHEPRAPRGPRRLFPQLDADDEARAAVITGDGRAFSAGGDFSYLDELASDAERRHETLVARPPDRHRHGALPGADRRRGQRPRGRARLQPRRPVRHRLHGRERAPGRPSRADRPGGRRRGPGGLAAAHQPAAGQGVRADRRTASRPGGPPRSDWPIMLWPNRCPKRSRARRSSIELPQQAVEATKRLMNIQLEKSVMASLDYANLAEYVSFGTADFNRIVDGLIAPKQ